MVIHVLESLQKVNGSINWWIGDAIKFGEYRHGDMYTQAIEATGKSYQHLADCAWVSGRYEFSERSEKLSWFHHRKASPLDGEPRRRLMKAAEAMHLSASTIQAIVRVPPEARAGSLRHAPTPYGIGASVSMC